MKVLVLSHMYPSHANPIGGVFVHEQVKALRALGHDARVAAGRPVWLAASSPRHALARVRAERRERPSPLTWSAREGVPVLDFPFFAGAFSRPWTYPFIYAAMLATRLERLRADFPYEIVHGHTAFLDGRAALRAARAAGVACVLTEHTGPFSAIAAPKLQRPSTLAALRGADRVLAVSQALRRDMLALLPELESRSIDVVPNGVDTAFFDPAREHRVEPGAVEPELMLERLTRDLRSWPDRRVLPDDVAGLIEAAMRPLPAPEPETVEALWIGHLQPVKRVDRLIEAFAIAWRRRPRLRLRLVGGGELEAALRAQADALGVAGQTTFSPSASRRSVREALGRAAFLTISSDTETFGVVGVEAMAMGLPVLTTDCGGPSDYVTDARFGEVVGRTVEDLAIGLQRMHDRLAGFDAQAIRAHARARFDFAVVARRLTEIYAQARGDGAREGAR
jgi:glycosyltransferase involved in cell wall biosynthesis